MPELIPWFLPARAGGGHRLRPDLQTFPIIGAMGAADRPHANFATRVSHAISTKRVLPFALTLPSTGIGLIWSQGGTSSAPALAGWLRVWST